MKSVFITRRLPGIAEKLLARHFNVTFNKKMSQFQLRN